MARPRLLASLPTRVPSREARPPLSPWPPKSVFISWGTKSGKGGKPMCQRHRTQNGGGPTSRQRGTRWEPPTPGPAVVRWSPPKQSCLVARSGVDTSRPEPTRMMKIPIFIADAFTATAFCGNPAAVCLLENKLDEDMHQKIAKEMNLSETAFIRKLHPTDNFTQSSCFGLRWFTPASEIPLCGHATLASAAVLFYKLSNNEFL